MKNCTDKPDRTSLFIDMDIHSHIFAIEIHKFCGTVTLDPKTDLLEANPALRDSISMIVENVFFSVTCKNWVWKTFRLNEMGMSWRYAGDGRILTLKIVLLTIPAYTYLPHTRFFFFHLFPRLKLLCYLNSLSAGKCEIFYERGSWKSAVYFSTVYRRQITFYV